MFRKSEGMIPIAITKLAHTEIKRIMSAKQIPPGYALRVGVKGTGCVGVSFLLGFDVPQESDQRFTLDGLNVLVSKSHMMYLVGKEVDFYEGADARGFVFNDTDIPG